MEEEQDFTKVNTFLRLLICKCNNLFNDPEWDGDPGDIIVNPPDRLALHNLQTPSSKKEKVVIKTWWHKGIRIDIYLNFIYYEGKPISIEEYTQKLFQTLSLPSIFSDEDELLKLWSNPITRNELLKN